MSECKRVSTADCRTATCLRRGRTRRNCVKSAHSWLSVSLLLFGSILGAIHLSACASPTPRVIPDRAFDFERDVLDYTNNNYWLYDFEGDSPYPVIKRRLEDIEHGQRCTIMSRTVRQFWYGARFAPNEPKLSDEEYRALIRRVIALDPRDEGLVDEPIVFPGYADLRSLSIEREAILKDELGGRWIGYFQRGNWRMIFPFSPDSQRATGRELIEDLERGHLPLVHVLNFPRININHTVLIFDYEESPLEITFDLYDPNNAGKPGYLVFDRATATFRYWRTDYFAGGSAKVYEVYDGLRF